MRRFRDAGIYLVTSAAASGGRGTLEIIAAALRGGIRLVQLREKELCPRALLDLAREARRLTAAAGALLIVNDRPDVALACGADGAHLGQDDLPVDAARKIAPDLIIGASCHTLAEALEAERRGASYVNLGAVFRTGTKTGEEALLGVDGVARIARRLRVPFTVIGGIKRRHVADLVRAGARTLAVISAVTGAADPERAARELLDALRSAVVGVSR
ncbi:MAG: thiamine phosphate synthase [Lentisphaerae bacterium]|nr:thiamine phosphate synthase [Lentisphaerota bacterium]